MNAPAAHGFTLDRFTAVQDAFADSLACGDDLGAAYCATLCV